MNKTPLIVVSLVSVGLLGTLAYLYFDMRNQRNLAVQTANNLTQQLSSMGQIAAGAAAQQQTP